MEFLSTRLSPQVMGKITKMAEIERRPLSAMARILLEEALEARNKSRARQKAAV